MKNYLFLFILFLIINCAPSNSVYWCGDHPCINKKEKEAYFKKTMIVEIKELKKGALKNNSEIEKIIQQAQVEEKKRVKKEKKLANQVKLEEKIRVKEEKKLTKQIDRDEKKIIYKEKKLARQMEQVEKKIIKKEKNMSRQSVNVDTSLENIAIVSTNFEKLVKKIIKKNTFRPYPDINDIPN